MPVKKKKDGTERYMSLVKLGPKGQIVIPKEARDMFGIGPGDSLLLLADTKQGIALVRYGVFNKIADAIFGGKGKEIYPELTDEDSLTFAKAIKEVGKDEDETEKPE